MYHLVRLCQKNFRFFKELNANRYKFNMLNEDFFKVYNNSGFFKKLLLKRNIYILFDNNYPRGYIWCGTKNNNFVIYSLSVDKNHNYEEYIKYIRNSLKRGYTYTYLCDDNNDNIKLLENAGFYKHSGTIEMNLHLIKDCLLQYDDVYFKVLEKGKEEPIRCKIQNEVFKNKCRIPLKITDIYFDEQQSYYFNEGSIFLKKNNTYIGYGQIIIQNNIPIIVNVGILKEFRGHGYGEALIRHLLKIIKYNNFPKAIINVDSKNKIALNLYKKCGFKVSNTHYIMKLVN